MTVEESQTIDYNDGLKNNEGVPIVTIIFATINTVMYMSVASMICLSKFRL